MIPWQIYRSSKERGEKGYLYVAEIFITRYVMLGP